VATLVIRRITPDHHRPALKTLRLDLGQGSAEGILAGNTKAHRRGALVRRPLGKLGEVVEEGGLDGIFGAFHRQREAIAGPG
jgi:hypothetical protein